MPDMTAAALAALEMAKAAKATGGQAFATGDWRGALSAYSAAIDALDSAAPCCTKSAPLNSDGPEDAESERTVDHDDQEGGSAPASAAASGGSGGPEALDAALWLTLLSNRSLTRLKLGAPLDALLDASRGVASFTRLSDKDAVAVRALGAKLHFRLAAAHTAIIAGREAESGAILAAAVAARAPLTLAETRTLRELRRASLDDAAAAFTALEGMELADPAATPTSDSGVQALLTALRALVFPRVTHVHPSIRLGLGAAGFYLYASRSLSAPLPAGAVLLEEEPAVAATDATLGGAMSAMRTSQPSSDADYSRAACVMTRARYIALTSLFCAAPPPDAPPALTPEEQEIDRIVGVWRANAFRPRNVDFCIGDAAHDAAAAATADAGGGPLRCLYVAASRINHSCSPNALQVFDDNSRAIRVVALYNVKPGDAVTLAYVDPLSSAQAKADKLGFVCGCELCAGPLGQVLEHAVCAECKLAAPPQFATAAPPPGAPADAKPQRVAICHACGAALPINGALEALERQLAVVARLQQEDPPRARSLALELTAALSRRVGPLHHARLRLLFEVLSVSVNSGLRSASEAAPLLAICDELRRAATTLLPPRWPTVTGLHVHEAYLRGTVARLQFASGNTPLFTAAEFARRDAAGFRNLCELVARAFEDHTTMCECDGVQSFLRRFRDELAVCGITTATALEEAVRDGLRIDAQERAISH